MFGKPVEKGVEAGSSIKFSEIKTNVQSPSKTYYEFVGWITNGNETPVSDSDTFGTSTIFNAKFKPVMKKLTFTFKSEGQEDKTVEKEVEEDGGKVAFSAIISGITSPTKTNSIFVGWTKENTDETVNNTEQFGQNQTFTAKFKEVEQQKTILTFTFTAEGATPATQSIQKEIQTGGSITFSDILANSNIQNPVKEKHGFVGWEHNNATVKGDDNFSSNTTFTAKFESVAGGDNRGLTFADNREDKKAKAGDVVYKDGETGFIVGSLDQAAGKEVMGFIYKVDADGTVHIASNNVHTQARWSKQNNSSAVYVGYTGATNITNDIPADKPILSAAVHGAENGFDAWQKIAQWHSGALFENYNAIATAIAEKKSSGIPNGTATSENVTKLINGSGVNDRWYLPTVAELQALYANKDYLPAEIKERLIGDFWSCELPANPQRAIATEKTALYVTFSGAATADKYDQKNVIAVTQYMVNTN